MHDVFAVGKGNKVQQRAHDADRVLLAEVAARHDLIKQLASAAQLHHLRHQGQQDMWSSRGDSLLAASLCAAASTTRLHPKGQEHA